MAKQASKVVNARAEQFNSYLIEAREWIEQVGGRARAARLSMTEEQAVVAINWFDVEIRPRLYIYCEVRSKHTNETWDNFRLLPKLSKDLPEWTALKLAAKELKIAWSKHPAGIFAKTVSRLDA